MSSEPFSLRSCRVALLGFGTVGSAVARRLTAPGFAQSANLQLTHVFDRRAALKRTALAHADLAWTDRIDDILQSDADVVVEAIGGVDPARAWTHAALAAGKSVVSANKQVIAREGAPLLAFAARQGRQLRFEAAVGGAMPIVRAVGDGLAGDRISRIVAILNGTTNAVLTRMEERGCSLAEAVANARAMGYAERDPSADLDGEDARAKLAILCALAFGLRIEPDDIPVRSTAGIGCAEVSGARCRGAVIRQIAHAEFDRALSLLTAWVAPIEVPADSIFGRTSGARNAAVVTGEYSGDTIICGIGAGGDATAVAIISDLAAIARDKAAVVPCPKFNREFRVADFESSTPNQQSPIRNQQCQLSPVEAAC